MVPLFGAVDFASPVVLVCLLGIPLMFLLGRQLFTGDQRMVHIRRECQELSKFSQENGFPIAASLLDDVALGDLRGLGIHVRQFVKTLHDVEGRKTALKVMLGKQLDIHLADPGLRQELFEIIAKKAQVVITSAVVSAVTKNPAVGAEAAKVVGVVAEAAQVVAH